MQVTLNFSNEEIAKLGVATNTYIGRKEDLLGVIYGIIDAFIEINGEKQKVDDSDWRSWEVGRVTTWKDITSERTVSYTGAITEKYDDHLICEADGMKLWIDDDTAYMFG